MEEQKQDTVDILSTTDENYVVPNEKTPGTVEKDNSTNDKRIMDVAAHEIEDALVPVEEEKSPIIYLITDEDYQSIEKIIACLTPKLEDKNYWNLFEVVDEILELCGEEWNISALIRLDISFIRLLKNDIEIMRVLEVYTDICGEVCIGCFGGYWSGHNSREIRYGRKSTVFRPSRSLYGPWERIPNLFMPTKPTINRIAVEDFDGQYHVRIYAENPHPSIGDAWNIFIQTYCKEVGIEYSFPS